MPSLYSLLDNFLIVTHFAPDIYFGFRIKFCTFNSLVYNDSVPKSLYSIDLGLKEKKIRGVLQ